MKYFIRSFVPLFALAFSILQSCDSTPGGDKATIIEKQLASNAAGQSFTIDTSNSIIRFIGNGVGKNHPGRFGLGISTTARLRPTVAIVPLSKYSNTSV